MAWGCVTKRGSLSDRCASQLLDGGTGNNSCVSPCRWQPAEQHQSLLSPNLSVSQSVWLCLLLPLLLFSPSALAELA